jgi:pyruvate/2-oxoglutarate dehydrogenase complex dihydrolipoamide dehydrogenase (E3) component
MSETAETAEAADTIETAGTGGPGGAAAPAEVEVVVIGMGPGGEAVAGRLAEAGLDVVGIDRELLGGECPYWGCVPSKMMIRAGNLLAEARRIPGMAGSATVEPDWAPVARRIREDATDGWDDRVAVERFEGKGGRFLRGEGRIVGPGRVAVGDRVLIARRGIVVGTGTRAAIPPIPGLDEVERWTNHEAIEAAELPPSLLVLGGGAIGAELAQVFARFGVEVTVIEALDRLVAVEEPEAGDLLRTVFEREGIAVRTGVEVVGVRRAGGGGSAGGAGDVELQLEDGTTLSGARILVATGRRTDLAGVGLGTVGVDESSRFVPVDERLRVEGADRVWAVGDITGKGAFTHVSLYQAEIAAADILGEDGPPADYRALPRVTFTDPEVGATGLTEAQARDKGIDVRIGRADLTSSSRGFIHGVGNEGFVKLVEDRSRGVLVGATSAGPVGGEVLGLLTLAVHAEVPTASLRHMIYAYPTFHRTISEALQNLTQAE